MREVAHIADLEEIGVREDVCAELEPIVPTKLRQRLPEWLNTSDRAEVHLSLSLSLSLSPRSCTFLSLIPACCEALVVRRAACSHSRVSHT